MISQIQNNILAVSVSSKGAELQSIINKETGLEYLWNGDAKFWAKKSPVLFPIVGSLKNNSYEYEGKIYHLGRHGFARDMDFLIEKQSEDEIFFSLSDNAEILLNYPFHFKFSIKYSLEKNKLIVEYNIENTGDDKMYFSVGGHPAFKVPLADETVFADYFLQFDSIENIGRYPLSADGLIEANTIPVLNNTDILPLQKTLFYKDALVFKDIRSNNISLKSNKTIHGLNIQLMNFPYLGIWNAKDADFVCIEPWCGIADNVTASGNLIEKEGINELNVKENFIRSWSVELF
jgi:galactose mutarotase-like enzyme